MLDLRGPTSTHFNTQQYLDILSPTIMSSTNHLVDKKMTARKGKANFSTPRLVCLNVKIIDRENVSCSFCGFRSAEMESTWRNPVGSEL